VTYATEKIKVGKKPLTFIKLKLDYCTLSYGVSPCNPSGARVNSDTAQSGGTNTIRLATSASSTDDEYNKYVVSIIGGTGSGQEGIIEDYVGATRDCTMTEDWSTQPDSTSVYHVIKRPTACYNTRATCQDPGNYSANTTDNNYIFTEENSDLPRNLIDESGVALVLPCLKSITTAPGKIALAKEFGSLGERALLNTSLFDFPHHDRGTDKYFRSRTYTPENQGTFWGKFITRNRYYQGRDIELHRGFIDDNGNYDSANFRIYTYQIENITGPTYDGVVKITAKDPLKLADDKRAIVPEETVGVLTTGIDSSHTTSLFLTVAEINNYPASGNVKIGSEIITYASKGGAGDLQTLTRGAWGTTAAAHSIGDVVQNCVSWTDTNVIEIIQDLLDSAKRTTIGFKKNANIATAKLDISDWETEKDNWLSGNTLTAIIHTPTGVSKLLQEILEQNLLYMYYDEPNAVIKLKAIAPTRGLTLTELNDDDNFIADSIRAWDDSTQRVSQVIVFYNIVDPTKGFDISNYTAAYGQKDTDAEGTDQYNQIRTRLIYSRWITDQGLGTQLAGRMITLLRDNPKRVSFKLDSKDTVETGDFVEVTTRLIQDEDGSNLPKDMLILQTKEL